MLMQEYRHLENVVFHPNQMIVNRMFYGTPLYYIISFEKNGDFASHEYVSRPGTIDKLFGVDRAYFTSMQGVYRAWEYARSNNPTLGLPPSPPMILVYNLEGLLIDCEDQLYTKQSTNFRIIPSFESYMETKDSLQVKTSVDTQESIVPAALDGTAPPSRIISTFIFRNLVPDF
nr:hypothetical protein [Porphyropsis coccinea]